jgi:hypothetical protein
MRFLPHKGFGSPLVRLVGVDTPERGETGYNEAAEFVESLRAVVYCGGVHVNRELLSFAFKKYYKLPVTMRRIVIDFNICLF